MKRLMVLMMALVLSLSLVACGGNSAPAKGGFTAEQQALAKDFLAAAEEYDKVVERVKEFPQLLDDQELVDTMNALADTIIAADAAFESPEVLTPEVMSSFRTAIEAINTFVADANATLDDLDAVSVPGLVLYVDVANQTGADLHYLALSPSNDENWGDNLLTEVIEDGMMWPVQLLITEDTMIWDIMVKDADGNELVFMGVEFAEVNPDVGAVLSLGVSDSGKYVAALMNRG